MMWRCRADLVLTTLRIPQHDGVEDETRTGALVLLAVAVCLPDPRRAFTSARTGSCGTPAPLQVAEVRVAEPLPNLLRVFVHVIKADGSPAITRTGVAHDFAPDAISGTKRSSGGGGALQERFATALTDGNAASSLPVQSRRVSGTRALSLFQVKAPRRHAH